MIVGLTGGIGAGKSLVASLFLEKNIPIYIADREAKQLMHQHPEIVKDVTALFGEQAYIQGQLNRKYIAGKVFQQKEMLKSLNEIVHPRVHEHFQEFVKEQNAPYVIYESAIIFENKRESLFDKIITVSALLEKRVQRVVERDGITIEDVKARIANQMDESLKIEKSDFVIHNNGDIEELRQAVEQVHNELIEKQ